jgi:hypothetical protein
MINEREEAIEYLNNIFFKSQIPEKIKEKEGITNSHISFDKKYTSYHDFDGMINGDIISDKDNKKLEK